MSDDARLDILKDAIIESDLHPTMKDVLADDLQYAQKINGTDDVALQGIKRLLISGIRRELMASKRTKESIKAHEDACMLRSVSSPRAVSFFAWLEALKPFMWPFALICFSPFAADILKEIASFIK